MTWRRGAYLLGALLLAGTATAAERWTCVATPNFEVYTTAGPRAAQDALKRFEQVREFFTQSLKVVASTEAPVRLILFQSAKEFEPYKPNEAAAAFYLPGLDRDFIVVGDLDEQFWPVATHEYVHLLLKYSGSKTPLWLGEGMAELFSTMTQVGDKMRVGVPPPGHLAAMRQDKPMPLEELFGVDHSSDRYTTKRHAGKFYSQSWALAHMLFLDPRYMTARPAFLHAVLAGTPPEEALAKVYAKTAAQVNRDLEGYVRQGSFLAANYPFHAPKGLREATPREVEGIEARLVTAELLASMRNKEGRAEEAVAALLGESGVAAKWSARVHETAAFFAWRMGKNQQALEHFEKAVAAGSENGRALADYAMLLGSSDLAKSESLLLRAVELRPHWVEGRVRLASVYNLERKHGAALTAILAVKRVRPAGAFDLFQVTVQAYAGLGQFGEARKTLAKAREYADTEPRRLFLEKMDSYLSRAEQRAELARELKASPRQVAEAAQETEASGERAPVMRRYVQPEGEVVDETPAMKEEEFRRRLARQRGEPVHGAFQALDCSGGSPVVVVAAADGRTWRFLVAGLGQVVVTGVDAAAVELTCGPQKSQMITVRYGPSGANGIDGIVKGLAFE